MSVSLQKLQSDLQSAIISRDPARADFLPIVGRDAGRAKCNDARDRLEVYQSDWWYRLLNHFERIFPQTSEAIGESFEVVVASYFQAHPSRYFRIVHTPNDFCAFLRERNFSSRICELADQEWNEVLVEAAPEPKSWQQKDFASLSEGELAALDFLVEPAFYVGRVDGAPYVIYRNEEDACVDDLTETRFQFLSWLKGNSRTSLESILERGGADELTLCLRQKILSPIFADIKPTQK